MELSADVKFKYILLGDYRYANAYSLNYLMTEWFPVSVPITVEFYLFHYHTRSAVTFFTLQDPTNYQFSLSYSNTNFQVKYGTRTTAGTCLKDVNPLPASFPGDTWYHAAFTWDGTATGFNLYHDGILQTPTLNGNPCTTPALPFSGQIILYTNTSNYYTLFRDLRVIKYIKTADEILRFKRKNHFYQDGFDNSALFTLYYPFDDITSSYCYRNIVNGTSYCLDPSTLTLSALYWRPIILSAPLFVCPDSTVYNTTSNMCEQGQAYPGYNLYFYLTGSNVAFSNQGITLWSFVSSVPSTSYLIASYQYDGIFYFVMFCSFFKKFIYLF